MILKGSQRGGGQDLAIHLMRLDDNEHIDIHELRGFVAEDLKGAFKEVQAVSRATRCKQYLFSLSLNPPETEDVPIAAFEEAVERIESKLGLDDQPRAIVFHEKEGRRHAHCVWSRIDAQTMTARPLSFFKTKLQDISRELYLDHGWMMPKGLADKSQRDPRNFTLEEWQQAKRAGYDPRAFKASVQDVWAISDSRASFEHALQERGLWLAKGDRRGHILLDHQGEVYSLARTLGVRAKVVRERLGDETDLAGIAETKQRIADSLSPTIGRLIETSRSNWKAESSALAFKRAAIRDRQHSERQTLKQQHEDRRETEARARADKLHKGVKGLWSRLTGKYAEIKEANENDAANCQQRDRQERERLIFQHMGERRLLQAQIKEKRGVQASLLRDLRDDRHRNERLRSHTPSRRRERTREPR